MVSQSPIPPPSIETIWALLRALQELMEERQQSAERALELKSVEYDRRLNELHYEVRKIIDQQAAAVARMEYERDLTRISDRLDGMQRLVYVGVGLALAGEAALWFVRVFKGP